MVAINPDMSGFCNSIARVGAGAVVASRLAAWKLRRWCSSGPRVALFRGVWLLSTGSD